MLIISKKWFFAQTILLSYNIKLQIKYCFVVGSAILNKFQYLTRKWLIKICRIKLILLTRNWSKGKRKRARENEYKNRSVSLYFLVICLPFLVPFVHSLNQNNRIHNNNNKKRKITCQTLIYCCSSLRIYRNCISCTDMSLCRPCKAPWGKFHIKYILYWGRLCWHIVVCDL